MSDNPRRRRSDAQPIHPPSTGLRDSIVFVLSVFATTAGCLASRGNGIAPAFYFLAGGILLPVTTVVLTAPFRQKRFLIQLILIALGGVSAFAVAYATSRRPPATLFTTVFGFTPSAGVHDLQSRVQWYDGEMRYLKFVADDAAFRQIVDQAKLHPDRPAEVDEPAHRTPQAIASIWRNTVGRWGAMAYDFWPPEKQLRSIDVYKASRPEGEFSVAVVREPNTGQVWAVSLSP